ncbi:MAG: sigma-70 family RNA polymerase sigma factor [Actinomycetota bacterium]|nr:sigma-70 family RNA polymerase sigma factor [Actinomycetota bacterium]
MSGSNVLALAVASEEALLSEYVLTPRPELEAELVRRFMPLARSLAMRYRDGAEPNEDLIQVASLALVKALRRYDPERGRRFAAFAAPTILGELRRHFRDHSWRLHMPRSLQERTLEVERTSTELVEKLGRGPTAKEVAERSGLSEEDVLDVYQAREAQRSMSLDVPVHRDEADSVPMIETVGSIEGGFDAVEAQMAVERTAKLDEREQAVIRMRFADGLNQYEIGEALGVSQMQVSRVMRRGLAKLLEAVQGDEAPDGKRTFSENVADARFPHGRTRTRHRRTAAAGEAA